MSKRGEKELRERLCREEKEKKKVERNIVKKKDADRALVAEKHT